MNFYITPRGIPFARTSAYICLTFDLVFLYIDKRSQANHLSSAEVPGNAKEMINFLQWLLSLQRFSLLKIFLGGR